MMAESLAISSSERAESAIEPTAEGLHSDLIRVVQAAEQLRSRTGTRIETHWKTHVAHWQRPLADGTAVTVRWHDTDTTVPVTERLLPNGYVPKIIQISPKRGALIKIIFDSDAEIPEDIRNKFADGCNLLTVSNFEEPDGSLPDSNKPAPGITVTALRHSNEHRKNWSAKFSVRFSEIQDTSPPHTMRLASLQSDDQKKAPLVAGVLETIIKILEQGDLGDFRLEEDQATRAFQEDAASSAKDKAVPRLLASIKETLGQLFHAVGLRLGLSSKDKTE